MKTRRTVWAIFVLIAFGMASSGDNLPQIKWKGTIATENGIKVVRNPVDPLYGTFIFDLEKDLAIGGNPTKEESYFPKGTTGLAVDDEGNIFVSDFGNTRVQMYDRTGKFIRTFGRKGQGPGEFQSPGKLLLDPSGNLYVFDILKIHIFEKSGRFSRQIALKSSLNFPFISISGAVFGMEFASHEPGGFMESLKKIEPDASVPQVIDRFRGEFKEGQILYVVHVYTSRASLAPIDVSSFCYGFSSDYRIRFADSSGQTVLIAEKDENPTKITGPEKDWIRKRNSLLAWGSGDMRDPRKGMIFPDHRPYFERLLSDNLGRIYALKIKPVLDPDSPYTADVFSRNGYALYRLTMPVKPFLIKAGYVYEVRRDPETDEQLIVRHRIRNWKEFKTGS